MKRFEYKLAPAPRRSKRFSGLKKGDDAFAHTIEQQMNVLALEGWEFLRTEWMVEDKRRFGLFRHYRPVEYMVFQRPLRENAPRVEQITPRRIARGNAVDIEAVRERARAIMSGGGSRTGGATITYPFVSTRNESA